MSWVKTHAKLTMSYAKSMQQRPGQALFNNLPSEAAEIVRGALFDPFHSRMTDVSEIEAWIDNHIIFNDEGAVIGVYNILSDEIWETPPTFFKFCSGGDPKKSPRDTRSDDLPQFITLAG